MHIKEILGTLASVISIVSSIIYLRQVGMGKIKPHAFSWLIWSIVVSLGFIAQVVKLAGPGAWATGFTALANIIICALAFYKGDRKFFKTDWYFLVLALLSCFLWWATKDPTLAVILAAVTNALGMSPTLFKAYRLPHLESLTFFSLGIVKYLLSLFALQAYSVATWLFPAGLLLANISLVLVLLIRRFQLNLRHK